MRVRVCVCVHVWGVDFLHCQSLPSCRDPWEWLLPANTDDDHKDRFCIHVPSPTDGLMVSFEIHQSCASAGVLQASEITPVNLHLGQGQL